MSKRFNLPALFVLVFALTTILINPLIFADDRGTPKFQVGKQYHAVYSCQSVPVPELKQFVRSCYEELWMVLAVGKDGWMRVLVVGGSTLEEWWVNASRMEAVREVVKRDAEPPPSHVEPGGTTVGVKL